MVLGEVIFANRSINEEKPQSNIEQEPKRYRSDDSYQHY